MPEVRPIDGNRLAELFDDAAEKGAGVLAMVYRDAAHFARTAPTIEPEVRHGRWALIIVNIGCGDKIRMLQCSECSSNANMKFDYCPNCGARMDGGAENG